MSSAEWMLILAFLAGANFYAAIKRGLLINWLAFVACLGSAISILVTLAPTP